MNKFLNWIIQKPERFFGIALIVFASIILVIDFIINFDTKDDWKGVLTEAHGMVLDILVFGILVSIYDRIRGLVEKRNEEENHKNEKIERYLEEIDDFRYWKDHEASVRLIGNIKRLQKLGITKFNLTECNLSTAKLEDIELVGSELRVADLSYGYFNNVNFSNSNIQGCRFLASSFGNTAGFSGEGLSDEEISKIGEKSSVNFSNAKLTGANFCKSHHRKTHFDGAYLVSAQFSDSILMEVHFEGAALIDKFEGEEYLANFASAHLLNCIAYKEQKEDFIKCGANINNMKFI